MYGFIRGRDSGKCGTSQQRHAGVSPGYWHWERIPTSGIEEALDFIYDPNNLQQVAFGTKNLTLSASGETIQVEQIQPSIIFLAIIVAIVYMTSCPINRPFYIGLPDCATCLMTIVCVSCTDSSHTASQALRNALARVSGRQY